MPLETLTHLVHDDSSAKIRKLQTKAATGELSEKKKEKIALQEALDRDRLPGNFRIYGATSASAQFNEEQLLSLLAKIKKENAAAKMVVVVDLRMESHIFINGKPVSMYMFRNQANKALTAEKITIEEDLLASSSIGKYVDICDTKKHAGSKIPDLDTREQIQVKNAYTEQYLATKYGAQYKRLHVLDHHRPSDEIIDQFIVFIRSFADNIDKVHFHFHCKGGKGRSTTFMALYEILVNLSKYDTVEDLNLMLMDNGGINLMKDKEAIKEEHHWKSGAAAKRKDLISVFWEYAKDPDGYAAGKSWKTWLKNNNILLIDEVDSEDDEPKDKKSAGSKPKTKSR